MHRLKDLPVRSFGFKHRAAMHDGETALLLLLLSRSWDVYWSSILHDLCDKCSEVRKKRLRRGV